MELRVLNYFLAVALISVNTDLFPCRSKNIGARWFEKIHRLRSKKRSRHRILRGFP